MRGTVVKNYRKVAALNDPQKVHSITQLLKAADRRVDRKGLGELRYKAAVALLNA